jgi:hypothetical protein
VFLDPAAISEAEECGLGEVTLQAEVYVLQAGVVAEAGGLEQACELSGSAVFPLRVHEGTEQLLGTDVLTAAGLEGGSEAASHAVEVHAFQFVQGCLVVVHRDLRFS